MDHHAATELVDPKDYPGLQSLLWNRDPVQPIPTAEAFALYERDWRHIDRDALTSGERQFVVRLTEKYGHGAFLGR